MPAVNLATGAKAPPTGRLAHAQTPLLCPIGERVAQSGLRTFRQSVSRNGARLAEEFVVAGGVFTPRLRLDPAHLHLAHLSRPTPQ